MVDEKKQPQQGDATGEAIALLRKIIKDALELKNKQDQEAQTKQLLQDQNAGMQEVQGAAITTVFLTGDADDAGNAVARAEQTGDTAKVAEKSNQLDAGLRFAAQWCAEQNGTMIEKGGDEFMMTIPSSAIPKIEDFRKQYKDIVGNTITIGIGDKMQDAINARMLGKLTGKNKLVIHDKSTDQELKLRLDQQGEQTENQKVAESLQVKKSDDPPKEENAGELTKSAEPKFVAPEDAEYEDEPKKYFDANLLNRKTVHNGIHEIMAGKHPITQESFENHLNHGSYSIFTAWNPHSTPLPKEQNIERNRQLEQDLHNLGAVYHDTLDTYGGEPEDSFMVHHTAKVSPKALEELARKYEQTSMIHGVRGQNRMLYVTGENMGKYYPGKGHVKLPEAKQDYTAPVSSPDAKVSLNFDFDKLKKGAGKHYQMSVKHGDKTSAVDFDFDDSQLLDHDE